MYVFALNYKMFIFETACLYIIGIMIFILN